MKYRVDIDVANDTKAGLGAVIDGKDPRVLNRVGAFASLFALDVRRFDEPVLVMKTEEPGSKQVLAAQHDRIESVCFDMINHLINDCVVMGAEPLAVQDLIICGRMEKSIVTRIVAACAAACAAQGCALTGGETTEQPDVVPEGTYILGSSVIGIVERAKIVDGAKIESRRRGDRARIIGPAHEWLYADPRSLETRSEARERGRRRPFVPRCGARAASLLLPVAEGFVRARARDRPRAHYGRRHP